MGNENKTVNQIIAEAKEATQENAHTEARILLSELAGHKNTEFLKNVLELHLERGDMSDSLRRLRDSLFTPVMRQLEIIYPDYIKAIKAAL
jgi:hypothetical protein